MIMGAIGGPINFHWQNRLEIWFPGWKTVKQKSDATNLDAEEKEVFLRDDGERRIPEEGVRVRNWFNIFRKWFTDCITMGALLNTTLFLVVMGVLKGKTGTQIGTDLRNVSAKTLCYCFQYILTNVPRKCGPSSGTHTKFGPLPTSSVQHTAQSSAASSFSAAVGFCGTSI
jgi:hypothetical protein